MSLSPSEIQLDRILCLPRIYVVRLVHGVRTRMCDKAVMHLENCPTLLSGFLPQKWGLGERGRGQGFKDLGGQNINGTGAIPFHCDSASFFASSSCA